MTESSHAVCTAYRAGVDRISPPAGSGIVLSKYHRILLMKMARSHNFPPIHVARTERQQHSMLTSFSRKKTARETNTVSDAGAQDLLNALISFLKPVIQRHASSSHVKSSNHNHYTDADLRIGLEGKNLLSALTAFVEVAMLSPLEVHSSQEVPRSLVMSLDENGRSEVPHQLPKEVSPSELHTKALIATRAHVFNKMPVRLLTFDKNGSNIQLIGRNEIFPIIRNSVFRGIQDPEFQSAWAEAETLEDSEFFALSGQYRSNKLKVLLKRVIKKSVHYAIMSHTWIRDTPGDITFQDWATRERNPIGNMKIVKFCEVAAQNHHVTLGWIDSVCINKESSSELDESIRSMYNWYRRSSVCVIFLSETTNNFDAHLDPWFTRGWTLQELLASANSIFYNENWEHIGCNRDIEILSIIRTASGITHKELELSWSGKFELIPFSRRMQMACGRQVTREEDKSYSLMGILGVDIPIAYGEGASRAFFRLVRELFNTKKNVIDLFNRSYNFGEGLLPSSLESYRYRSTWWDHPNTGTILDMHLPHEPIIPTHLGLRTPLLLAPLLLTPDLANVKNYVPKGDVSATMLSTYFLSTGAKEEVCSLLSDNRLYTGDLADLRSTHHIKLPDEIPCIRMLGIVNFGIDTSGHILLPEKCLALKFDWDGVENGKFEPPRNVMIRSGIPYSFELESKKGFKIPKTELGNHGMQLVSLCL